MDDNKWCPGFKCLSREARRYTEQKLVQGENEQNTRLIQGVIYKSVPERGQWGGGGGGGGGGRGDIINALLLYCLVGGECNGGGGGG